MSRPGPIVVIGGGVAGVSACVELRQRGYQGALTLVDEHPLLHDRPPLSKGYLLGEVDDAGLQLQPPEWFEELRVDVVTDTSVRRVDPGGQVVELADATVLPAAAVILATGGRARPLPGVDSPRVHTLRTLSDAEALRAELRPGRRVLVIGGGLIGAEIASTAKKLGAETLLAEPALPLAGTLGEQVAHWLHGLHGENGIEVYASGVGAVTETDDGLQVELTDGRRLVVDLAIAGIGMVPDTTLAEQAGARCDRGVLVDDRQRTSVPGMYAIGDCARPTDSTGTPLPHPEHWEAARHGAARAAAAILDQEPPAPSATWFWSDRHGHHLEVVGDPGAGEPVVRGVIGEPPFAVFGVRDGRLLGALSVDQPQAVRAARRMIDRDIPVDPTQLADPGTDLRKLLKRR